MSASIPKRLAPKITVLAFILVVAGVVWLVLGSYQQRFDDWATVTVVADRAGLNMDRGAKVTMTGAEVGEVTGIDYTSDQARLNLRLHRPALASIPANVTADITSNTFFGAKSVRLEAPTAAAAARLTPGAVIDISRVTVEINTVFEQLTTLMHAVDPAQLQATLGALATALQGRGDRLGAAIDHASGALALLNSADPGIADLLRTTAPATGVYADIAPDLMRTLGSLTTTGHTLVDNQKPLANLLASGTTVANTATDLLNRNGSGIVTTLRLLTPTVALLDEYSPVIPCVFKGITQSNITNPDAYGGQPGVKMFAGLIPGVTPYKYPQDLPKVHATGGPHCLGLPYTDPVVNPPYMVTDTGVNPYAPNRIGGPGLRPPSLIGYLFGIDPARPGGGR